MKKELLYFHWSSDQNRIPNLLFFRQRKRKGAFLLVLLLLLIFVFDGCIIRRITVFFVVVVVVVIGVFLYFFLWELEHGFRGERHEIDDSYGHLIGRPQCRCLLPFQRLENADTIPKRSAIQLGSVKMKSSLKSSRTQANQT